MNKVVEKTLGISLLICILIFMILVSVVFYGSLAGIILYITDFILSTSVFTWEAVIYIGVLVTFLKIILNGIKS